jgi:GTP-binding protein EngB required for normal cell division
MSDLTLLLVHLHPQDNMFTLVCPECGKACKSKAGLASHTRACGLARDRKRERSYEEEVTTGGAADSSVEPSKVEHAGPLGSLFKAVSKVVRSGRAERPPNHSPQPSWLTPGINWAVVGESSVGKSSLINAILVSLQHPWHAARAGDRKTRPTPFSLRSADGEAKLWDMPMRGAQFVPDKDYLEEQGFRHFHGVIIVGWSRVQEFDLELIRMLEEARVPWYYVRTHLDQDVNSELVHGRSPEDTQAAIRARINARLARAGLSSDSLARVYLVSNESEFAHLGDWATLSQDLARDLERSTQTLPAH